MRRSAIAAKFRLVTASALVVSAFSAFPAAVFAAADRIPDDTYFPEQWHLQKIRAPQAWNTTLGFEGVTIAIIDSGVDIEHPDLKENIWINLKEVPLNGIDDDGNGYVDDVHGWDFVSNDSDPRPDISGDYDVLGANHGTVDAGIAAARGGNGRGIAGVAWQSSIMPLRVLDSTGNGNIQDVVRAIEYAMHNGAKIINLSFAGPANSQELAIAARRAYDAGVFIVVAAGNAPEGGLAVDLDRSPLFPVCLDSESDENFVYGVAAVDENDVLAPFSNYGAACIDISAPGSRMISTQLRVAGNPDFAQSYGGFYNGTSLAAAEVSGVVALIRSLDYNLTPKQIVNILTETSVSIDAVNGGRFGKYGRGRIDAAAAVEKTLSLRRAGLAVPVVSTASLLPPGSGRVIVAASGPGRASDIRLFTEDGLFIRSFSAFAEGFRGGVSVATANFDGNQKTIVAGAMAGGSPQVRIFDINSRLLGTFLAYDDAFRGGVSMAAGDLDGDGKDEIVTGAGPGGGPHVRVFTSGGVPIGGFFAFDAKSRAGVDVFVADLDGDGKAEIVTAAPNGTTVKVFSAKGVQRAIMVLPARLTGLFFADVDGDKKLNIVTRFVAAKYVPAMRAYNADGFVMDLTAEGKKVLSTGAIDGVALRSVVYGTAPKTSPVATVFDARGAMLRFAAFEAAFKGGVNTAVAQ